MISSQIKGENMNLKRISHFFIGLSLIIAPSCLGLKTSKQSFDITTLNLDESIIPALVLGGGTAGLTAAVYFAQAHIPCIVIEGPKPGGALAQSHSVRNWPGIINAPGMEIVSNIREQAKQAGTKIMSHRVTGVSLNQWPYHVTTKDLITGNEHIFKALSLVITLGAEPNYLGIPGEKEYWGRGVSNCAVCDGSLFKGKKVAVVGGGDAAIEEADYLSDIAEKVTLLVRSNAFRAKDLASKKRVLGKKNVSVVTTTEVKEVKGNGKQITGLTIINNKTKQERLFELDGLFLAIGSRPNTSLFTGQLDLDGNSFIKLTKHQETSRRGVYAAGDVCDQEFVQAITASGDACKAALQATKFLKEAGFNAATFSETQQEVTRKKEVIKGVINISSQKEFNKYVINSQQPVVIDLFADWCGPCKRMTPIFDALSKEFEGKVTFAKIDIQHQSFDLNEQLGRLGASPIRSIPAFIFVSGGRAVKELIGAHGIDEMRQIIRSQFGI